MAMALQASQQQQSGSPPQDIAGVSNEEAMLNQAIMQSLSPNAEGVSPVSQEPLNPEQRKREAGVPCGLKNIGNTCYFNSILQVYFNIPEFAKAIMEFKDDLKPLPPLKEEPSSPGIKGSNDPQDAPVHSSDEKVFLMKLEASRRLIKQLQILFG